VPGKTLTANLGSFPAGTPLVASFTGGPLLTATTVVPSGFASGTPYGGPSGYWNTWGNQSNVLQDYRQFNPVHKGNICNIAFVDGSVRSYADANGDGQLNNGFPASSPTNPNGFADPTTEIYPTDLFSGYSLQGP
jgi:prepilin-type processing-associated H-X9-DG protein